MVLDDLNARLAPHGLHFAPDVATSSRATIGGMIANNSCGAHSIVYGRTVDHLAGLTVVLSDGSVTIWPSSAPAVSDRARLIETRLAQIARTYRAEIEARFPKVMRRNGGYALDRIADTPRAIDPTRIVCGSEGTLCLIVDAVLRLTPLPAHRALLLVHFDDLLNSLSAVPLILEHAPAAVELVDQMIFGAARIDPASRGCADLVDFDAAALLIVEFFGDAATDLQPRLADLERALSAAGLGRSPRQVHEEQAQEAVWTMRKRGLGLLMARPGDVQGQGFVEDTAVDPSRLRDYIERFQRILSEEGIEEASYYAHASVGVIHVRPALNLKTATDVERMRRVADRVSDLALEFGGAMTAEHGDGLVRSCWIDKMFGPTIVRAFEEVKDAFDPEGLFNPGKIVHAPPMTDNLRFGADYRSVDIKTHLDFSEHGGFAGLAQMCSGVGDCRRRAAGTMCPSFMATGDEMHTTRARANALRIALSNRGLLHGLGDAALDEVMDLCLLCKACIAECPTGVDMARLKVEWLAHRNKCHGLSRAGRMAADAPRLARMASRFPRLSNLLLQARPVRAILEARYELDRRVPMPGLAHRTFRHWFKRRRRSHHRKSNGCPPVVYLVDTWTNYYTPQVGMAAVRLLEAAGYTVIVPELECCGRTLISKGLLDEARQLAKTNVQRLVTFADTRTPIVGTEPSCVLTLTDEYPRLLCNDDARTVARVAQTVETFLHCVLTAEPGRLRFGALHRRILYHGHCHEKALVGTSAAMAMLNRPPGFEAEEIDSGCCGMAGSFGHEKAHYDVSRAIGAERLFPAVHHRGDRHIAVSGFSCRHQIATHTGVTARHSVEHLADALPPI